MNDFKLDILFKFLFNDYYDDDCRYLLHLLIENLLHRDFAFFFIQNPKMIQKQLLYKEMTYDIRAFDEKGRRYELEMHNTSLFKAQIVKFGYYGFKLINDDMDFSNYMQNFRQHIQIIFIEDEKAESLIDIYESLSKDYKREGNFFTDEVILLRFYINMPYIKNIEKKKGIKNLTDFEMFIYIIENGLNKKVKKEKERRVVKAMIRRLEKFNEDAELGQIAQKRHIEKMMESKEKKDMEMKGCYEQLLEDVSILMRKVYPDKKRDWIKTCNYIQLQQAIDYIFDDLDYERYKEIVLS